MNESSAGSRCYESVENEKNMSVGFNFDSEIKAGSVLFTRTVLLPALTACALFVIGGKAIGSVRAQPGAPGDNQDG